MQLQLINLSKESAWNFFSNYFGLNNSFQQTDVYALLISNCENSYFTTFFNFPLFLVDDKILIPGKLEELSDFADIVSIENPELAMEIIETINKYKNFDKVIINFNNRDYNLEYPLVMGILNVTPDSFSDGGNYIDKNKAIEHALEMISFGADIIDVGGESTRPDAEKVSVDEEIKRVIPVIDAIAKLDKNIPISIDTTKSEVAQAALESGATIVNDISAFTLDEKLIEVVYNFNASYVLMHMQGTPITMQKNPTYVEPVSEIYSFLSNKIKFLEQLDITKIIVDPGIGFGKRVSDNFKLIERLDEFKSLGKPIMAGLSRKSFLGKSLNIDVNQRDNSTVISEYLAVLNGARIIRTHNVRNATEMKKLFQFYKYPSVTSVYD